MLYWFLCSLFWCRFIYVLTTHHEKVNSNIAWLFYLPTQHALRNSLFWYNGILSVLMFVIYRSHHDMCCFYSSTTWCKFTYLLLYYMIVAFFLFYSDFFPRRGGHGDVFYEVWGMSGIHIEFLTQSCLMFHNDRQKM